MPDPVLGCLSQATNHPCNCLHMSIIYTVGEECTPIWAYICKSVAPAFCCSRCRDYLLRALESTFFTLFVIYTCTPLFLHAL